MPTPMMPQVPTSMRLRGLYMSTMERVKSSALAPSLTSIASGLALTMSRTTLSALWKFIGLGFFASVSAILATLPFFLSATALVHSAGGLARPLPMPASNADTHEPMSPTRRARAALADQRRIDAHVAVGLLRRDVDLDELLAAPGLRQRTAPGLALAVRQQPVQPRSDQHHHVGGRQHERARSRGAQLVRVGQQALGHRHRQVRDAALFDQCLDVCIGLRVRRALA